MSLMSIALTLFFACGEKEPDDSATDDSAADDSAADDSAAPALENSWSAPADRGCGQPVSANLLTVHGAEYGEHVLFISDQPWTCEERLAARVQIVQADAAYTQALANTGSSGRELCEAAVARWQAYAEHFDPFFAPDSCAVEVFFDHAPSAGSNAGWLDLHLGVTQDSAGVVADLGDCATDAAASFAEEDTRIFTAVLNNLDYQSGFSADYAVLSMDDAQAAPRLTLPETLLYAAWGSETITLSLDVAAERCEE